MPLTIFQSDSTDFMGGRQRLFKALDAVENMGSEEGLSIERASWSESSRRQTNMVLGRRVTSDGNKRS
jgi:hypothetical protein